MDVYNLDDYYTYTRIITFRADNLLKFSTLWFLVINLILFVLCEVKSREFPASTFLNYWEN